jgi:hypothetical protein
MDKIFTASDDAKRKKFASVTALVRGLSVQMAQRGQIAFPWDGRTVSGEPVEAIVDHGRWLGQCDRCGNPEYVDPETPIFFCMRCGNGDSRAARPVHFPENRVEVEKSLLAIKMVPGWGRNDLERMLSAKPAAGGMGRDWSPAISDQLLAVSDPPAAEAASPQMPATSGGNLGGEDVEVSDGL